VMCFLPVNSMPFIATVGSCTSSCCCRHLLCLLCLFPKRFRHERPDGSLPACAWGTIALPRNPYPNDYRVAFASSILPYPHACRLALRFAFPNGRHVGLPRSVYVPTDGLGPACSPVAVLSTVQEGESSHTSPHTFWFKLVSVFSLLVLTTFISSSHMLTMPSNASSRPP
jgi:hypothetical protein